MGFGDFVRKETRRVLNNLLSQQPGNISPPGLNNTEFITFTNGERTKGKTDSGIEVDTIPIGMPRDRDLGIRVGAKQYLVRGRNVRYRSIDQSLDLGLYLYQGIVDSNTVYYVRKAKSRTFYLYTPPTINTHATIPAPIESGLPDNDMRLSSGFFKSPTQWFNYVLRFGNYDTPVEGLNPGDIGLDWAYIAPSYTTVDNVNTITNAINSSGSFIFNSSALSAPPDPNNNNTFVMSAGYEETATAPSDSRYTWTVSNVLTYGDDTDPGAITEYNSRYSNDRQPQLGAMVLTPGNKIDICDSYIQTNYPFQAKILESEVTTFHGTFRTVFSETYGPDPDNLTTHLTPLQGEWEAVTSTVYTYGPSINGVRSRTATTTYSITQADLLEYTPLGVGQAIDTLNSGGPLGSIDLVTNPSPPFGYLQIYCHPPLEIEDATFGTVTSTALYYLTQPGDAFLVDLSDVEDTESYLGDLPLFNTVVAVDTVPGYYADIPTISRTQTKFVTISDVMNSASLNQTVYFDAEEWTTETATSDSVGDDLSFNYNNTTYGGYSVYNDTETMTVANTTTGWDSDTHSNINNNFFSYFGTFLGAPSPKSAFKTTDSNGEVFFTGINTGLTALVQNRADFSLSTNNLLSTTPQFFPYIKWHPINGVINQVVDQVATFGLVTPGAGNFHLPKNNNKITVFKYISASSQQYLTSWSYNVESSMWVKGKELAEDYHTEPLVYPEGISSVNNVNQFALF
jgi:hypothetical protein